VKPTFEGARLSRQEESSEALVERQAELVRQVDALPPGKQRDDFAAELETIKRLLGVLGYRGL
jgi:hypothetical protein